MKNLLLFAFLCISSALFANDNPNWSLAKLKDASFEKNKGQFDEEILFSSNRKGYELYMKKDRVAYKIELEEGCNSYFEMQFLNASLGLEVLGGEEKIRKSNYLVGKQESHITNVSHYGKVFYKDAYPDIDLKYYAKENQLKYDFIVKQGGDVKDIELQYNHINQLYIASNGDLVIQTDATDFIEEAPFTYQIIDGIRKEIKSKYVKLSSTSIGFEMTEEYDKDLPLIIDPTIEWATWFSDDGLADGYMIDSAVDGSGNFYGTGRFEGGTPLSSTTTLAGSQSGNTAYVIKLSADGTTALYSTYIGGDSDDSGMAIEVDALGQAHVVGVTRSSNLPVSASALSATKTGNSDAFLHVLNAAGNGLVYGTYFGGTGDDNLVFNKYGERVTTSSGFTEGMPFKSGLEIDGTNVYIIGNTYGTTLPNPTATTTSGSANGYNLFLAQFDISQSGTNSLVATRTLGGTTNGFGSRYDSYGTDIELDGGTLYFTGATTTSDFNSLSGTADDDSSDGIIGKVSSNLGGAVTAIYQTGSTYAVARALDIHNGEIYVIGDARRGAGNAFNTLFSGTFMDTKWAVYASHQIAVTVYNTSTLTFQRGTWFGQDDTVSSSEEYGTDIVVDGDGNVSIAGHTFGDYIPDGTAYYSGLDALVNQLPGTNNDNSASTSSEGLLATFTNDLTAITFGSFVGGSGNEYGLSLNGAIETDGWIGMTSHSQSVGVETAGSLRETKAGTNSDDQPFIIRLNDLILPVELTGIKATLMAKEALINWSTASEENSSHFEIEKSLDGRNFDYLGKVSAQGNSAETNHYDFTDSNLKTGMNYYRLKMVDFDDSFEYSTIVKVFYGNSFELLNTFPSSVKDIVHLTLFGETRENLTIEIIGSDGKSYGTKILKLNGGVETLDLDVSFLPSGMFYLVSTDSQLSFTSKFLKY